MARIAESETWLRVIGRLGSDGSGGPLLPGREDRFLDL